MKSPSSFSSKPTFITYSIVVLRIVIGWHFLYEGLSKLFTPGWTSADFLQVSAWIFAPFFHWIADTPLLLAMTDWIVIAGTILAGATLLLGFWDRWGAILGMFFLAMFWLANPPLIATGLGLPTEGNYLFIDKNVVEFFALLLTAIYPTGKILGLSHLLPKNRGKAMDLNPETSTENKPAEDQSDQEKFTLDRRTLLRGLATLPIAGVFGFSFYKKREWESFEEQNLLDANASASVRVLDISELRDLKGQIPKANIKDVPFSRLILGGNLMSGWAHARDLIYVSNLVKAYHSKEKIFATLNLAEKCGVDTLLTNTILCPIINEYWQKNIGKIQFISDCAGLRYDQTGTPSPMPFDEYLDIVKRAIDMGTVACYIQGETADYYMSHGEADRLARVIDLVRQNGVICGIGAHRIETLRACVDVGLEADFWMKTLHHHNYWSAQHPDEHDNKYCYDPDGTISFMKERPEPFIAFKVLAAGAIHPTDGFRYAFENGADFICAGMYDFQMVDNVNTTYELLTGDLKRERPWMA